MNVVRRDLVVLITLSWLTTCLGADAVITPDLTKIATREGWGILNRQANPGYMFFEVLTSRDPLSLVPAVRQIVSDLDRSIPLEKIATQAQLFDNSIGMERFFAAVWPYWGLLCRVLGSMGCWPLW